MYNKCSNVKSRGRPNDINFFATFLSPYSSRPSIMQRAVGTRRSSSGAVQLAMPRLIKLTSITRWARHFIRSFRQICSHATHSRKLHTIIRLGRKQTHAGQNVTIVFALECLFRVGDNFSLAFNLTLVSRQRFLVTYTGNGGGGVKLRPSTLKHPQLLNGYVYCHECSHLLRKWFFHKNAPLKVNMYIFIHQHKITKHNDNVTRNAQIAAKRPPKEHISAATHSTVHID